MLSGVRPCRLLCNFIKCSWVYTPNIQAGFYFGSNIFLFLSVVKITRHVSFMPLSTSILRYYNAMLYLSNTTCFLTTRRCATSNWRRTRLPMPCHHPVRTKIIPTVVFVFRSSKQILFLYCLLKSLALLVILSVNGKLFFFIFAVIIHGHKNYDCLFVYDTGLLFVECGTTVVARATIVALALFSGEKKKTLDQ